MNYVIGANERCQHTCSFKCERYNFLTLEDTMRSIDNKGPHVQGQEDADDVNGTDSVGASTDTGSSKKPENTPPPILAVSNVERGNPTEALLNVTAPKIDGRDALDGVEGAVGGLGEDILNKEVCRENIKCLKAAEPTNLMASMMVASFQISGEGVAKTDQRWLNEIMTPDFSDGGHSYDKLATGNGAIRCMVTGLSGLTRGIGQYKATQDQQAYVDHVSQMAEKLQNMEVKINSQLTTRVNQLGTTGTEVSKAISQLSKPEAERFKEELLKVGKEMTKLCEWLPEAPEVKESLKDPKTVKKSHHWRGSLLDLFKGKSKEPGDLKYKSHQSLSISEFFSMKTSQRALSKSSFDLFSMGKSKETKLSHDSAPISQAPSPRSQGPDGAEGVNLVHHDGINRLQRSGAVRRHNVSNEGAKMQRPHSVDVLNALDQSGRPEGFRPRANQMSGYRRPEIGKGMGERARSLDILGVGPSGSGGTTDSARPRTTMANMFRPLQKSAADSYR
jgi:hypothetical protein